jgi:hypothetical protein
MSLSSRSQTTRHFNSKWNAPRQWKAKTVDEAPVQKAPQKELNTDLCSESEIDRQVLLSVQNLLSALAGGLLTVDDVRDYWDNSPSCCPIPQLPDLSCEQPNGKPQNGVATGEPCYLLYHNDNDDNNVPDNIKNIRGIFTDLAGNILCKSFPFIPETTPGDDFFSKIPEDGEWYKSRCFMRAEEGTQLRLWWSPVEERWIISTTRKIDAFSSEWGHKHKKSFGQLALEALADININFVRCSKGNLIECDVLDKDRVYCLLLTSEFENRVVCRNVQKKIYTLGCFRRSRNFRFEFCSFYETLMPSPPLCEDAISCKADLVAAIIKTDPLNSTGILTFDIDSMQNGCMIKFIHPEYKRLFDLRGNEACHLRRYVDLRNQPEEQKEFARLYSEIDFSQVETAMQKAAEKITKLYVEKYCYKVQLSNDLGYITRRVLRDMKEWARGIRNIQPRHAMQEINKLSRREFWSLVSEQLQGQ